MDTGGGRGEGSICEGTDPTTGIEATGVHGEARIRQRAANPASDPCPSVFSRPSARLFVAGGSGQRTRRDSQNWTPFSGPGCAPLGRRVSA